MEDSSNASDDFARNRIRHQVIPVLEDLFPGFGPGGRVHGPAPGGRGLPDRTGPGAGRSGQPCGGGLSLEAAALAGAPAPVAARAVRLLLGELWGGDQDCARVHLESVLDLCRGEVPSAQADLPHGTLARRCYGRLELVRETAAAPPGPALLPLPGELTWGRWRVVCAPAVYGGQPQGPWDFWLDRALSRPSPCAPGRRGTGWPWPGGRRNR